MTGKLLNISMTIWTAMTDGDDIIIGTMIENYKSERFYLSF